MGYTGSPDLYQLRWLRRAGEIRATAAAFLAAEWLWQGKINNAPKPMTDGPQLTALPPPRVRGNNTILNQWVRVPATGDQKCGGWVTGAGWPTCQRQVAGWAA